MTQPGFRVESVIPTLAMADLADGIAYFEKLGFTREWTWPEEAPTHAGLCFGEVSIMLCECDPKERGDLYFIVDDVEKCHTHIAEALGGDVPEPSDAAYGLRDFSIRHPHGHQLTFGQPLQTS